MGLWQDNLINKDKVIHKWAHYFPIYERYFEAWRNKSMVFWELGVYGGGSLQMWQRYFGPSARIIGLDINPRCLERASDGIEIRIGDQADTNFLQSVIGEFGPPDVVLDDASHLMEQTWTTFQHVYPQVPKNGVYMVEDMHTSYWPKYGGGLKVETSFINRCKHLIDELNADHTRGDLAPTEFTRTTDSISFHDSMVVFVKGNIFWKRAFRTGAPEELAMMAPRKKPRPTPPDRT